MPAFLLGGAYPADEPGEGVATLTQQERQRAIELMRHLDRLFMSIPPAECRRSAEMMESSEKGERHLDCFFMVDGKLSREPRLEADLPIAFEIGSFVGKKEFYYGAYNKKYSIKLFSDKNIWVNLPMNSITFCFNEQDDEMHLVQLTNKDLQSGEGVFNILASLSMTRSHDENEQNKNEIQNLKMYLELIRTGFVIISNDSMLVSMENTRKILNSIQIELLES
jgi:hypothetical protein